MPLILRDFSPVGGQSRPEDGPMVWSYTTPDDIAAIIADGYFNDLRDVVESGDMVMVEADTGTTATQHLRWFDVVPKSPLLTDVTINVVQVKSA